MILIVADTGPVNYLIQIGCIGLLARLAEKTVLPASVALARLRGTSCFLTEDLIENALERDAARRRT